jgi:hypothetical protein
MAHIPPGEMLANQIDDFGDYPIPVGQPAVQRLPGNACCVGGGFDQGLPTGQAPSNFSHDPRFAGAW